MSAHDKCDWLLPRCIPVIARLLGIYMKRPSWKDMTLLCTSAIVPFVTNGPFRLISDAHLSELVYNTLVLFEGYIMYRFFIESVPDKEEEAPVRRYVSTSILTMGMFDQEMAPVLRIVREVMMLPECKYTYE